LHNTTGYSITTLIYDTLHTLAGCGVVVNCSISGFRVCRFDGQMVTEIGSEMFIIKSAKGDI